jgi:hypothetical protein
MRPTLLARGRGAGFASPAGIQPRNRVLRCGFFPPNPPRAGKACRWIHNEQNTYCVYLGGKSAELTAIVNG